MFITQSNRNPPFINNKPYLAHDKNTNFIMKNNKKAPEKI